MRLLLGLLFLVVGPRNISCVQKEHEQEQHRVNEQYKNNNNNNVVDSRVSHGNTVLRSKRGQRRDELVDVYHNNKIVQSYETDVMPKQQQTYNGIREPQTYSIASQSCPAAAKQYVVTCLDGTANECHDEIEDANITIVNPMDGMKFFAVCIDNAAENASLFEYADLYVEPDVVRSGSIINITDTEEEIYGYNRQVDELEYNTMKELMIEDDDGHHHRQTTWTRTTTTSNTQPATWRDPWQYTSNIRDVGAINFWNNYNKKGDGVTVCIVDSGIDRDHPRFRSTTMDGSNEGNLVDPWYEDVAGHGTHIAGIIAAEDRGKHIVGVAPNANLFVTRIFDQTIQNSVSSLILALDECKKAGSKIINLSLGGPSNNTAEEIEMNELIDSGVLVIAAAGNSGNCCSNPVMYPASYQQLMSVAALKSNTEIASFSTHNHQVDISAPGNYILGVQTGGGVVHKSGTSMACPHVVGAAALLMSQFPTEPASRIREAIENSAVDLGPCGYDDLYGHGRLDIMAAAAYLDPATRHLSSTPTCVEVTVNVQVENKGDLTKWRMYVKDDQDDKPELFFRGGPYRRDEPHTYTKTFTIPDGKLYEFRVYDDYNNGHGTYELTVAGSSADLSDSSSVTSVDDQQEDYWVYPINSLYSSSSSDSS